MRKNKTARMTHVKPTDSDTALCGHIPSSGGDVDIKDPGCGRCMAMLVDEYMSLKEDFTDTVTRLGAILTLATPPGCVTVDEKDVKTDAQQ